MKETMSYRNRISFLKAALRKKISNRYPSVSGSIQERNATRSYGEIRISNMKFSGVGGVTGGRISVEDMPFVTIA